MVATRSGGAKRAREEEEEENNQLSLRANSGNFPILRSVCERIDFRLSVVTISLFEGRQEVSWRHFVICYHSVICFSPCYERRKSEL